MQKKIVRLILILAIFMVLYATCIYFFGDRVKTKSNVPTTYKLTAKPRLEDDFYDYVNYDILSEEQLKNKSFADSYQTMTAAQEKIDTIKKDIIKDILSKCGSYTDNSVNKKICDLYNSYKNVNEQENIDYIKKYIDRIENINSIEEYVNTIINLERELSVVMLVNPSIYINYKTSEPNFTLAHINYDWKITDSSIYKDNSKLEDYIKTDIQLLELIGYDTKKANVLVNNVQKMYKTIARFSKNEDLYDITEYELYNITDLDKELNNISIQSVLKTFPECNLKDNKVLVDYNQLKEIDNYLKMDNLDTLKGYAILQILTEYSEYLSKAFNKTYRKIRYTYEDYVDDESEDEDEVVYMLIYDLFRDTIVEEFEKKYITEEDKKIYKELITSEIDAFKKRIMSEEWLEEATREKAYQKLDKMKYTIVNTYDYVFAEKKYNFSDSYISNIIEAKKKINLQVIEEYKKKHWFYMSEEVEPLVVNAYYSSIDNSINIILGMMYAIKDTFKYDPSNIGDKYYEVLGSIGTIIGHELTHSLDDEGSKYDENGRKVNWWTKEDRNKFNELNSKIIKYYNKYNQEGYQTLGENIADLGGVNLVIDVAESKGASNDDYKVLFESYAKIWAMQATSYYKYVMLVTDVHSPDKSRVNAVLSSNDKFYEIYNIESTDGMYVSKENRVYSW